METSNSRVDNSLFDNFFATSLETPKPVKKSASSNHHEQKSELASTFSIDIDPFSSSSSSETSFNNNNNNSNKPLVDPFGISLTPFNNSNKTVFDPFSVFDSFTNIDFNLKMSEEKESNQVELTHTDNPFEASEEPAKPTNDEQNDEQNEEPETPPSSIFFYRPSIALNNPQLTYVSQSNKKDSSGGGTDDDDDNIDNAFITYSSETRSDESAIKNDELQRISNELAETKLKLTEILEEEEETDNNGRPNLVDRVVSSSSSSDSDSVSSFRMNSEKEAPVKFSIENIKITKNDDEESDDEAEKNEKEQEQEEQEETNMDNYFVKEQNSKNQKQQHHHQSTLSASPDPMEESKTNTVTCHNFKMKNFNYMYSSVHMRV